MFHKPLIVHVYSLTSVLIIILNFSLIYDSQHNFPIIQLKMPKAIQYITLSMDIRLYSNKESISLSYLCLYKLTKCDVSERSSQSKHRKCHYAIILTSRVTRVVNKPGPSLEGVAAA